jgi:acyl dehydratase
MNNEQETPAEFRSLIGKTNIFTSPDELGRLTIRRFAVAVEDNNPVYFDEEYASKTRHGGTIAPPTMIFELNHNIEEELSEEDGGHAHFFHMLPSFKPAFIRGGNEYEFLQPARPNDRITIKQEISRIYTKEAKAGQLIFVVTKNTYSNQNGEVLGINWETWIFPPNSRIK